MYIHLEVFQDVKLLTKVLMYVVSLNQTQNLMEWFVKHACEVLVDCYFVSSAVISGPCCELIVKAYTL